MSGLSPSFLRRSCSGTKEAFETLVKVFVIAIKERRWWVVSEWESSQWPREVKYSVEVRGVSKPIGGGGVQVGRSRDMPPHRDTRPKLTGSLGLRSPSLLAATLSRSLSSPQAWSNESSS